VSFAGISLTVILLAAAFVAVVALGMTGKRRAVLAGVVAFYPATLIYQAFPWYTPQTSGAAVAMWLGCFLVCFWALRDRVDPTPLPRLGRFGAAIALAVAALALIVWLNSFLPLGLPISLPGVFGRGSDVFLSIPVLFILFGAL
jgi:hypothetical protein